MGTGNSVPRKIPSGNVFCGERKGGCADRLGRRRIWAKPLPQGILRNLSLWILLGYSPSSPPHRSRTMERKISPARDRYAPLAVAMHSSQKAPYRSGME